MPTRALWGQAEAKGVPLEQVAQVLLDAAIPHFGPRFMMEVSVEREQRLIELRAAFRIKPDGSAPGTLSLEKAKVHLKMDQIELEDEILVTVFFAPEQEFEADAQDHEYEVLTGLSQACSGFWPVARKALAPLLDLPEEDPIEVLVQRALLFAVASSEQRGENFVLRRGRRNALFIKERVIVGAGEISAGHFGRGDLLDGVEVEVIRREVPITELIDRLFGSDAVSMACEGTSFTTEQLVEAFKRRDVHLDRKTAFRTSVARMMSQSHSRAHEPFARLVRSEREARFIP
jgi:hypothetical protein